ncbi:MAG: KTSC domain-containing protein [Caulobacter sp.]|nr:KTSC domain-containing protein [Caulobacter sp.]
MPFNSTAIRDIRYEDDRQKLFVTFTNGGEYVYVGVPGELHRSFVEADSQGRFFVEEIRDRFPFNRLDS